jgi:hypothetical protein
MPKLSKRRQKELQRQRSMSVQKKAEARNRQCGKKKRYNTDFEAFNAGKFAFRDGRHVGTYLCPQCNKWHITTKRPLDKASAM